MFRLIIEKESFKFSATHFALFGPGCAERLHGHNYYIKFYINIEHLSEDLGMGVEFNELKPMLARTCRSLDEYILVPENSPYLKISSSDKNVDIQFNDKHYSFPKEDVKIVPLLNITVEELSQYIWHSLYPQLKNYKQIKAFGVEVQETKGQKCLFEQTVSQNENN